MNLNNFIWIDALDEPLSNGENRCSLSGTYQKLFKKYPPAFFLEWAVVEIIVLSPWNNIFTHPVDN
jgi:hypothetical protein